MGIIATFIAGYWFGPPMGVLVLATLVGGAVIALFWQSLRTLIGETPLSSADTFAAFSPGSEAEQKRAILRALKDLEYERNVGKISEEDYLRLMLRYRENAKSLLRLMDGLDEKPRAKAEELVREHLRAAGLEHNAGVAEPASVKPPSDEGDHNGVRRESTARRSEAGSS